jgi:hypothetical protein
LTLSMTAFLAALPGETIWPITDIATVAGHSVLHASLVHGDAARLIEHAPAAASAVALPWSMPATLSVPPDAGPWK